jgi:hypothetical protein
MISMHKLEIIFFIWRLLKKELCTIEYFIRLKKKHRYKPEAFLLKDKLHFVAQKLHPLNGFT